MIDPLTVHLPGLCVQHAGTGEEGWAHMSHMSWTSRWRLCGASFMAKTGDPGTSPWTCLNISRTSLSLATCVAGRERRSNMLPFLWPGLVR